MKKVLGTCLLAVVTTVGIGSIRANAAVMPIQQGYGQEQRGWDAPNQEWNEIQRRGFHDGIEGAHRDADNHRQFNVNNRDEYRHPNMPGRDRRAYRRGFEKGYRMAIEHMEHGERR